jgi:hypothetical protein
MKNYQKLGQAIGQAVNNDEAGIRGLLKRNGVNTSLIKTKKQLANAFIKAMFNSKALAKDFLNYLKSKTTIVSSSNFLNNTGAESDGVLESANSNSEKERTWMGEFLSGIDASEVFNTILNVVNNSDVLNQNGVEIESTQSGANETVNSNGGNTQPNTNAPSKSSNTMLYVVIGGSAILIATTVFLLMKNRKK